MKQALGLLKALAGNDDIKVAIVKSGGIQLILAAMTQHQGIADISYSIFLQQTVEGGQLSS